MDSPKAPVSRLRILRSEKNQARFRAEVQEVSASRICPKCGASLKYSGDESEWCLKCRRCGYALFYGYRDKILASCGS
jgi:tRNA(Ile2) C34 agmatinyltransferase TiaS